MASSASDVLQSENFVLTVYSESQRHDLGVIMPLQNLFSQHFLQEKPKRGEFYFKNTGIGSHCVYRPLNLCLAQVSNMMYPECENFRDVGWIACNSVLSGLYAKGITECDSIMMHFIMSILIETEMSERVIGEIVAGFKACAEVAKVKVTNSPLFTTTYVLIGGTATSICHINDFAASDEAVAGDTIVVTKPLGTLVSARANSEEFKSGYRRINDKEFISIIEEAYEIGLLCMKRSNKIASILMKKYNAHASIDLNGQSLLQSALELAKIQKQRVQFRIYLLPLIMYTQEIDEEVKSGLANGLSQELCGGLLICFSSESAKEFLQEITKTEGLPCFYVGKVYGGDNTATISPEPEILPIAINPTYDE